MQPEPEPEPRPRAWPNRYPYLPYVSPISPYISLISPQAARLAKPLPNWHALPLRPLAPLKAKDEAARRKGRESFY